MSLLPQTILPPAAPFGRVIKDDGQIDETVTVRIETNWWLFLFNLSQQVLGGGSSSGLPASALIELGGVDSDANDSDAMALRQPIRNLQVQQTLEDWGVDAAALRRPLSNALLLAQDALLPDPVPVAQPVAVVALGASPAAYTAPFRGTVVIAGGTVTIITLTRQGTAVATGLTAGIIPVSRGDILTITYAVLPTVTFLPN